MVNINIEFFKKILKEKGYKTTYQRECVLETLINNARLHMTAEEIYQIVKEKCPEIGLATIYRTINLFHNLNIVDKLDLGDGFIRYEIRKCSKDKHHHHHLICENCEKVIEAEDDLLDLIEETCFKKYGFKVNNHIVKFYGICSECSLLINENIQ